MYSRSKTAVGKGKDKIEDGQAVGLRVLEDLHDLLPFDFLCVNTGVVGEQPVYSNHAFSVVKEPALRGAGGENGKHSSTKTKGNRSQYNIQPLPRASSVDTTKVNGSKVDGLSAQVANGGTGRPDTGSKRLLRCLPPTTLVRKGPLH